MASVEERRAILEAAQEVTRTEAAYKAALARFDALIEGRTAPQGTTSQGDPLVRALRKVTSHKGKTPDPNSINQRVLEAIKRSPAPVAIESLALVLNVTPKQAAMRSFITRSEAA